ncbi:MAG TPA: DUF3301 domain-containing protein [Gammaproteobacteria bacterium]|nr:DUF3301 domain-containing protein [Gammaproteobacteria bacterium]
MYIDLGSLLAFLALIAIALGIWFWNDSLQAREHMTATCARICGEMHLQFLDETVALARLRLTRTATGWLAWRRMYVFEFSESGSDRWKGRALLTGRQVESVQLDNPQGVTILDDTSPPPSETYTWQNSDRETEDHDRLH